MSPRKFVTIHCEDKDILYSVYTLDINALKIYADKKNAKHFYEIEGWQHNNLTPWIKNTSIDLSKQMKFTYDKELSDALLLLEELTSEETRVIDWYIGSKENQILLLKKFSDLTSRLKSLLEL